MRKKNSFTYKPIQLALIQGSVRSSSVQEERSVDDQLTSSQQVLLLADARRGLYAPDLMNTRAEYVICPPVRSYFLMCM